MGLLSLYLVKDEDFGFYFEWVTNYSKLSRFIEDSINKYIKEYTNGRRQEIFKLQI